MDRRNFIKITGGTLATGASCAYAFRFLTASTTGRESAVGHLAGVKWGMLINLNKCQDGCTACLDACRQENNVAMFGNENWDVHWIRKVKLENKIGGETSEKSVPLLCNHCDNPPCAQVCPVQATYKRDDGIVVVDHHRCIGCRYCMIACPYNARFFNFKENHEWTNIEHPKRSHGVAEACNFCAHRLDRGGVPACVEACSKSGNEAIMVGNLDDHESQISEQLATNAVSRIREDLGTEPKVYYIGL